MIVLYMYTVQHTIYVDKCTYTYIYCYLTTPGYKASAPSTMLNVQKFNVKSLSNKIL